jgi:hypothetical protein
LLFQEFGHSTVTSPAWDVLFENPFVMQNLAIRTAFVLLRFLLCLLFGANLSARERRHLSMKADSLYREAQFNRRLNDDDYLNAQRDLMDKGGSYSERT